METTNQITLTKTSTDNEITIYFQKVLELKQSGEEFPVNLELVWTIVYNQKSDAVSALKRDFIECVDFQSLRRNPQRGASSPIDYYLTVSCMEYFIARKVRPVFDVYRKVFHKVAEQKNLSQLEILQQSINLLVAQERRLNYVENQVSMIVQKQMDAENELKALPISTEEMPEISLRDKIRFLINRYCSAIGINHKTVWDNIYQTLYYNYHVPIKSYHKLSKNETWLEVAERKGHLDKIYIIVSNLLRMKGLTI
jgi:hypothetical protein